MKRSGHSVVGYGKYMLLFGGIDFSEEVVYNDLYALNLGTYNDALSFSLLLDWFSL